MDLMAEIQTLLQGRPEIDFVFLFGSHARHKATRTSDVDLAIQFVASQVPDPFLILELKDTLEQKIGIDVDLLVLNSANPIIKMQVLKKGQIILLQNQKALSNFFVRAVMEYDDLKKMRAGIENKILSRRIHG